MPDKREETWTPYLRHILGKAKAGVRATRGIHPAALNDDDLWQVTWEAFCRAEKSFDPKVAEETGAKFTTYLYRFVFFELKKHMIRTATINARERDGCEPVQERVQGFLSMPSTVRQVDRNDLLQYAMSSLSAKEVRMLAMYYVEGLSYRDIEEALGVSYTTVRNHMAECINKLRRKIRVQDEDFGGS